MAEMSVEAEKVLVDLLGAISTRIRLFKVSQERMKSKAEEVIEDRRLNEHETLLVGILGLIGGGSDCLNLKDIHDVFSAISRPTISITIKSLCKDGYVSKRVPSSKSGYTIHLTEKGQKKYAEIKRNNAIAFSKIIKGFKLEPEDIPILHRYFTNLIKYFDEEMGGLQSLLEKIKKDK